MTFLILTVAPALGIAFSWALGASSIPGLLKDRKAGRLSTDPMVFPILFVNCLMWTLFAAVMPDKFAFLANLPGVILTAFSTTTALKLCEDKRMSRCIEALLIGGMLMLALAMMATVSPLAFSNVEARKQIIGMLSAVYLVLVYVAPCQGAWQAAYSGNVSKISLPLALAATANAICWVVYGIGLGLRAVIVPHSVGVATGTLQIIAKFCFGRKQCVGSSSCKLTPEKLQCMQRGLLVSVRSLPHSTHIADDVASNTEPEAEPLPVRSQKLASLLRLIPHGDGRVAFQLASGQFLQVIELSPDSQQGTSLPTRHRVVAVKSEAPGEAGQFVPVFNPSKTIVDNVSAPGSEHDYKAESISFWNPLHSVFMRINEAGDVDCSGPINIVALNGHVVLPEGWIWERFIVHESRSDSV